MIIVLTIDSAITGTHHAEFLMPVAIKTPLRVFVSYSHQDTKWLKLLDPHLRSLANLGVLESFDDRQLLGGDTWDPEIRRRLDEADLIILIITANFMASEYIARVELSRTLERRAKEHALVIPILADHCFWQPLGIAEVNLLPKDDHNNLRPLIDWGRQKQSQALAQIAQHIWYQAEAVGNRSTRARHIAEPNVPTTNDPTGSFADILRSADQIDNAILRLVRGFSSLVSKREISSAYTDLMAYRTRQHRLDETLSSIHDPAFLSSLNDFPPNAQLRIISANDFSTLTLRINEGDLKIERPNMFWDCNCGSPLLARNGPRDACPIHTSPLGKQLTRNLLTDYVTFEWDNVRAFWRRGKIGRAHV